MANEIQVDIELNTRQAIQSLGRLENSIDKFAKDTQRNASKSTQLFTTFGGVLAGNLVTGALSRLGNTASAAFGKIADSSIALEQTATRFEVLTGSASAANDIIQELQEFTATTPFQFEGVSQAAAQLLSFGFEIDTIVPRLRTLGDVASGSGSDLKEVALIFGQVSAAGKLTGERLLQLQERAIPIGSALAKSLGVAESQVRQLVSEGRVSFADFEKAFQSLTDESGLFFEATIKQSKTLDGVLSTLSDNATISFQEIGEAALPTARVVGVELVRAFQSFTNIIKENQGSIKAFVEQGIGPTIVALGTVLEITRKVGEGFRIFINSLTAGIATIGQIANRFGLLTEFSDDFANQVKEDGQDIQNALDSISTDKLSDSFINTATSIEESLARENAAVKKSAEVVEESVRRKREARSQEVADLEAFRQERLALEEEERQLRVALEEERASEDLQRLDQTLGREEAVREQARINRLKANGQLVEAEKKQIASREKAERESVFRIQKFEEISSKQRLANLKSTLGTIATLQSSSSKELFAIGKAAGIATATIDGISAVQKALASAPPPLNFALAALVGVATAANIAKIASARPPAFQDGGVVGGFQGASFGPDNTTALVRQGEMILNAQQQRELFNTINEGTSQGLSRNIGDLTQAIKEQPIVVEINGREIARATRDESRRGALIA